MLNTIRAPQRAKKRRYRHYGDLVRLAAQISGKKPSSIYGVLRKRHRSAAVSKAIEEARQQLARNAGEAAA